MQLPYHNTAISFAGLCRKAYLSFKKYISLKAGKFGTKSYEVCKSSTGYMWPYSVYTWQGMKLHNICKCKHKTAAVVTKPADFFFFM
jgi:hypothetical protein